MSRQTLTLIFAVIIGLIVLGYGFAWRRSQANYTSITLGSATYRAEIADTPGKRLTGLSGRTTLGDKEAMVFIFEKPGIYSFWMKEMLFSIDIIWIDENKKVIAVDHSVRPESYPATYQPKSPIRFVVEVNGGQAKDKGIREGSILWLDAL